MIAASGYESPRCDFFVAKEEFQQPYDYGKYHCHPLRGHLPATRRLVLWADLDKASKILALTFFSSASPILHCVAVTWVVQMSTFYYEVQIYVIIPLLFLFYVTSTDRSSIAKLVGLSEAWHLQSGFWKYFSLMLLNAHQNLIPLFCQHVGLLPHPPACYQFLLCNG